MNAGICRGVVLGALLCIAPESARADSAFEARLQRADTLRTSDATRFAQALDELDAQAVRATAQQKMHLRLLHTYRLILSGDNAQAISELKDVLATTDSVRLRYRAGAMLANTYAITRRFEEGLKILDSILPLSKDIADPESRHHGYSAASILYNQVGEFKLGLHFADKVREESTNSRSRCLAGELRLESLQGLGTMPDDPDLQSVISHCGSLEEPILTGFAWTYLARKRHAQGRTGEAIEILEQYLPNAEGTAYPRLIGEYQALLAEYRLTLNELDAAQGHAAAAIKQSIALGSAQSLVVAYKTLHEIADRRGDPVLALHYYRRYAEADKAYVNDVKSREMAYQVVRHQALQQTQQIALLNQQNALLQLQQSLQTQSAENSRLMMLLLAVLMSVVALWAYRTRRMQVSVRRMAQTDALTGVFNRHHFTQQSEAILTQSGNSGEVVAMLMFDLDHFKSINDRFGHAAGDWVLKKVVETCRPICRGVDCLGRIGGEEFAIILPGYDLRAASRMADDCRVQLSGIDTIATGHVFQVTASFGIATSRSSGYDLTRLLSRADRALYRAKRGGRNQVRTYEDELPTPSLVTAVASTVPETAPSAKTMEPATPAGAEQPVAEQSLSLRDATEKRGALTS